MIKQYGLCRTLHSVTKSALYAMNLALPNGKLIIDLVVHFQQDTKIGIIVQIASKTLEIRMSLTDQDTWSKSSLEKPCRQHFMVKCYCLDSSRSEMKLSQAANSWT